MAVDLQKLKRKMRGVTSTRQVTRALQMVSAMKMRKAQELSARSRAYRKSLIELMETFDFEALALPEELVSVPQGDRILVVSFASDRGLCGPYNTNIITAIQRMVYELQPLKVEIKSVGWKVGATLQRRGYKLLSNTRRPAEQDRLAFMRTMAGELMELWRSGEYQRIYLLFSALRGMTVQKPTLVPWLPFQKKEEDRRHPGPSFTEDFIDEPDTLKVFAATIRRYLDNSLLSAVLESEASEHVARMVAMDNATRNAEDLYRALQLTFNKARQAKITQEICEIVSGANAIGKG
jgi:F-type H+-transporting ATPase subunit gamma